MNKIFALLLALTIAPPLLAGCEQTSGPAAPSQDPEASPTAEPKTPASA